MAEILRNPSSRPWLLSISQAAGMLAMNILLRAVVA